MKLDVRGLTLSTGPNPFVDKINVILQSERTEQGSIRIVDLNGKIIKSENVLLEKGANNLSINNLSAIPGGMYVIEVSTSTTTVKTRLVK